MQPGPTTYYNFHKFLLSALGLWPYNRSKFFIIKNTVIVLLPALSLIPQLLPFTNTDVSVDTVIKNLSPLTMCLGAILKYTVLWYQSDIMKEFMDGVSYDWTAGQGDVLQIFKEHAVVGKYYGKVIAIFIYPSALALVTLDMWNLVGYITVAKNLTYESKIPLELEYNIDERKYFLPIIIHRCMVTLIVATVFVASESMMVMLLQHCSSLFDVTRFAKKIISSNSGAYIILIILGVISLSANLYRLSQVLFDISKLEDALTSLLFIASELAYMFFVNYNVQQMTNSIGNVVPALYNSNWYESPIAVQKMLFVVMLRCTEEHGFTFYGMYYASIEGFSVVNTFSFTAVQKLVRQSVSGLMIMTSLQ